MLHYVQHDKCAITKNNTEGICEKLRHVCLLIVKKVYL